MNILIYGAGVIGCELAHILKKNNDVTLLARGKWKNNIDRNGLIIRHYAQFKTTKEKIKTISELKRDDVYDIIFVTMQYTQLKNVLSILAENRSKFIVIIGNNMNASYCEKKIKEGSQSRKEIVFAFISIGGRRESGKVISIHFGFDMTIGGLNNELSSEFKQRIKCSFKNKKYKLERKMDSWLKCHLAFILPICYVCYKTEGHLEKASKSDINNVIDAVCESHMLLKSLGYEIRPDGEEEFFTKDRKKNYIILRIMAKTPLGRLAASDHAMHAVSEMSAFDREYQILKEKSGVKMPVWDKLRCTAQKYLE